MFSPFHFRDKTTFYIEDTDSLNLKLIFSKNYFFKFLHLLGCDTNGHANKPHSKELLHNIKVLNDRVMTNDLAKHLSKHFQSTYYEIYNNHNYS